MNTVKWFLTRVGIIYFIVFVFFMSCVDLKILDSRIKIRHLNAVIPNFAGMIIFSKHHDSSRTVDWTAYKNYFELILRFMPDDAVAKQLLGFVDYHMGQQDKSIDLFKSVSVINGQGLFWSNYNLGVIYYKKGMLEQASQYLLKAIASNRQLTLLIMQNSIIYKQIFASSYFTFSLNDEMNDALSGAYILLLSCLRSQGKYNQMLVIASKAIDQANLLYKDAFFYYAGLGGMGLGQMENAYLFFQKSISLEKNNPDVYFYLADIFQSKGQEAQARKFLEISYSLHQKNDARFPYDQKINLRFF
ncbi:MAG: tetratricopeptide repeat protein [Candidatus Omnitrophica bacterium]|nr:tetratricopeptide repeat protein [Candidatus Omnitrophota bacterium]